MQNQQMRLNLNGSIEFLDDNYNSYFRNLIDTL